MTNTYNTGNPLGSTSPKDLYDNASNFDDAMNSTSPSFNDRFLKRRQTWSGMQKQVADFLEAMGFEATHLQYVDGNPLTVLRPTQLIDRAPSVYKVKQPAVFPVNLTGTWATDQLLLVDVGDAALRSELASSSGATMVGALDKDGAPSTVQAELDEAAAAIGVSSTLVASVADVRLLPATFLGVAETTSYYSGVPGGSGRYVPDLTDVTSADDGFMVLVSTGGVRRKLLYTDRVLVTQAGVLGDYTVLSNTGTDNGVRLQVCHDKTPRGVTVHYPLGLYFTTTTILFNGGSSVEFQSRATSGDAAQCAIVGATALDGVVLTQFGDTTHSIKVVNMVITRQTGAFASTARGLITSGVDQQVFEDCAVFRHGICVHVHGQLSPYFSRLNTWMCTGSHVKISECVEPRFHNCRFGRNGGFDLVSNSYVEIDGSLGIQVDTVDFTSCQFNQSGNTTNIVMNVVNYNNPNGIFTFTGCHMESWGTFVLGIDASTPRLQRVKFIGCTITNGAAAQFVGGTLSALEDLQLIGCTIAASMSLQNSVSATITGGDLAGNLIVDGGKNIVTGARITGNATFLGTVGKLTFTSNQISGSISDTFTGTKIIANNI